MMTERPSVGTGQAAELRRRAVRALKAGDAAAAEALARQSLGAAADDRGTLYLLGLALLALGRSADAVEPLQGAAEGNPDPAVETNLATALAQSGKEKEALEWLERATSREPPFAPAFTRIGRLLHIRGSIVAARTALARAVELAPDDSEAWFNLADTLTDLGETRPARDAYTRALALRPGWSQARVGIVRTLMDEGNYEAPIGILRRLIASEPEDAAALLDLAFCLQETGRLEEALESYRRAAAADPRAYKQSLHSLIGAARGTFWLRPSAAVKKLPPPR